MTTQQIIHAEGSSQDQKKVQMKVIPQATLFEIDNMKPGDWAPRTVEIHNIGTEEFDYSMWVENEGHEMLFNELVMEIESSSTILYEGKLSEFTSLNKRSLKPSEKESLTITIRFPEHLGNEFQGQGTVFSFFYQARGTYQPDETDDEKLNGVIDSGTGPKSSGHGKPMPQTATDMGLFLLIGLGSLIVGIALNMFRLRRKRA